MKPVDANDTSEQRGFTVAILGTNGVPARYGGFETLAERLVVGADACDPRPNFIVYCSAPAYAERLTTYHGATLRYLPVSANGAQSLVYDHWSLCDAILRGVDVVVLLGHGGSFFLPLVRALTRVRIVTNVDGLEWQRTKWSRVARTVLRLSERCAVRYSHAVIADNDAICDYVMREYGRHCDVVAYGGDQALASMPDPDAVRSLPARYALALCRIEPENNVHLILEAFARAGDPLVFVGNWSASDYGRLLRERYRQVKHLILKDPVYDSGALRALRDRAWAYVHGHSAGGTNPSLVEMMHFGIPVFAHGCVFNRATTEDQALYFETVGDLVELVVGFDAVAGQRVGLAMRDIAQRRYLWSTVVRQYNAIFHAADA